MRAPVSSNVRRTEHVYQADKRDRVVELKDIPQSSIGAPIPVVVAAEHFTAVAFYMQSIDPEWDGTTVKVMDVNSEEEPIAIVRFNYCYAQFFGPPNEEAISGHPLHTRGLEPFANFEVEDSSWIRTLEKMNSVHPYHKTKQFMEDKRHFILAFHDSVFECVAKDYSVETTFGSIRNAAIRLGGELGEWSA